MKTLSVLFAVLLGVSLLSAAAPTKESSLPVDWVKAEQNYIANLASENTGVITSAITYIRKYRLSGAVDELKKLLANEKADNVKMSAALALLSVGGDEGRTAVEEALKTEESEIVAEFYRTMLNAEVTAGK